VGDAYIEKTISVVPGYNRVFKVHYKITHFGADAHAEAPQELPVVYVNGFINKFWYYGGDAPWTNDGLLKIDMPMTCCINLYTPEDWGAYADNTGSGLAMYSPGQFPNSKGFTIGSASQFTPTCPYSWDPGSVLDFDFYILVGPVDESRAVIYELHKQQSAPSPLSPLGYLDLPQNGDTLHATIPVQGWTWALSGIATIDVTVDGISIGSATYHITRDVTSVYPGAPPDVGFEYSLDTTSLSNGPHDIVVKATDANSRVATFATKHITVSN
jgi:hypothetical protein